MTGRPMAFRFFEVMSQRLCPACLSQRLKPFAAAQPEHLLRCLQCGLVFECRTPSDQELADYYRHYSYSRLKPCSSATQASFRRVLESLAPWQGQGRLLDLGCGQGDFLVAAAAAHWRPAGMEFSQDAVALCRQRGLEVLQGANASSAFFGKHFDVVTAFEVLEHLRTPGDLLRDAASLLMPGGLLYLTTPNFNTLLRHVECDAFQMLCSPEHLCFFTPASLRRLAVRHGFRVAAMRTTGLDPWRLKKALRLGNPLRTNDSGAPPSAVDPLNALREAAHTRRRVALLKASVNSLVNAFGAGDTLKAWLVKV
ncbi:class I SAM-dependent methyltransferase [Synechococcus sp. FGCU-3]|nr:class I SAM-dependent methyltransferase [Synechococcus sp. FGCU3]